MAKTLLNGINDVLTKAGHVSSTSALSSLTDSGKQLFIDHAIQAINETLIDVYTRSGMELPNAVGSATLTLATSDRDYDLAITDFSRIIWPIVDPDNDYFIYEYPGGWKSLYQDMPLAADWQGRAEYAAIRPTDGELLLDLTPTATENGLTYVVYYEKDTLLTLAADAFPMTDIAYTALLPAITERYNLIRGASPDFGVYRVSLAGTARLLTQTQPRRSW